VRVLPSRDSQTGLWLGKNTTVSLVINGCMIGPVLTFNSTCQGRSSLGWCAAPGGVALRHSWLVSNWHCL